MPRIRYLKPDFFKDEDLATLPFELRLLFAGLWNFADKEGRLEDRPLRLKVEIFPYDKVDVEKGLEILSKPKKNSHKPFIQRYEAEGEKYIQIVNWHKHQKPHHTEAESKIPPAPPLMGIGMGMEKQQQGSTELRNGEGTVKQPLKTFPDYKKEIIEYLNKAVKKNFPIVSPVTDQFLRPRYNEGRTVEDCKMVIDNRVKQWLGDPERHQYLRPSTLFRPTNFENWITEAKAEQEKKNAGKKREDDHQKYLKEVAEKAHKELEERAKAPEQAE